MRLLSLSSQGLPDCQSRLLRDEADIVEMVVDIELEPGARYTLGCPLKHSRLTDPNDPGSSSEVIVPLASEYVGLLLVAASDPRRVFEPLCHPHKMAKFFDESSAEKQLTGGVNHEA